MAFQSARGRRAILEGVAGSCATEMAAYTKEQLTFIVERLASYVSAEAIATEFQAKWKDTRCDPVDVANCDREHLPADWQAYFDHCRSRFLDAPTADKRVRVAFLDRMASKAYDRGAYQLAAQMLAQIKDETGDASNGPAAGDIDEIEWVAVPPAQPAAAT